MFTTKGDEIMVHWKVKFRQYSEQLTTTSILNSISVFKKNAVEWPELHGKYYAYIGILRRELRRRGAYV